MELKNLSNYHPIGNKLIVWIDCVEMTKKTAGGILINSTTATPSEQAYQATTGILMEITEECYAGKTTKPVLGDRLVFRPYSGIHIIGDDGNFYRILEDREINAVHAVSKDFKITKIDLPEEEKSLEELFREERANYIPKIKTEEELLMERASALIPKTKS